MMDAEEALVACRADTAVSTDTGPPDAATIGCRGVRTLGSPSDLIMMLGAPVRPVKMLPAPLMELPRRDAAGMLPARAPADVFADTAGCPSTAELEQGALGCAPKPGLPTASPAVDAVDASCAARAACSSFMTAA